jgi:hypothetical protein
MSSPETAAAALLKFASRVTLVCAHCSQVWRREVAHRDWPPQEADIQHECPSCGAAGEAQVYEAIAPPHASSGQA